MNNLPDSRLNDVIRFYDLLDCLKVHVKGFKFLKDCNGKMDWPDHGVYFFFEDGETRMCSGTGLRAVRVGTHALTETSKSTLWNRLRQHRGIAKTGLGNHRGSVFRKIIGDAIGRQCDILPNSWGVKQSRKQAAIELRESETSIRECERKLETRVSQYIGKMPFLWLCVPNTADRKSIELNAIALLSNYERRPIDLPSEQWLGHSSVSNGDRIRQSGLWNSRHVDEQHDLSFLDTMDSLIRALPIRP